MRPNHLASRHVISTHSEQLEPSQYKAISLFFILQQVAAGRLRSVPEGYSAFQCVVITVVLSLSFLSMHSLLSLQSMSHTQTYGGLLHCLLRERTPPPQVLEQEPNFDHEPQLPSWPWGSWLVLQIQCPLKHHWKFQKNIRCVFTFSHNVCLKWLLYIIQSTCTVY